MRASRSSNRLEALHLQWHPGAAKCTTEREKAVSRREKERKNLPFAISI